MPVIKRYSNRKLYDTEAKRYITLEGLADLIREGAEVHITDHETGEDITALILAQTVFDLEKRLKAGLPGTVLTNLIRAGSGTLSQLRDPLTPEDTRARVDDEIERRIQLLVEQGELDQAQGARLLDQLIAVGEHEPLSQRIGHQVLSRTLKRRGIPSRTELQQLVQQVEALSTELDQLKGNAASKPKSKKSKSKPRPRRS